MGSPLKERLSSDMREALRQGDRVRLSILRLLVAELHNDEIATGRPLEDSDVVGLLAREVKRHQESITAFKQGNRPDLVEQEERELSIIKEYLPPELSRDEVLVLAREVIAELGARGPRDKGKVMARLMPRLKGQADGREVSALVDALLATD